MVTRLGEPLPDFELYLYREGKHGLILDWYEDDAMTSPQNQLNGTVMHIIIGERSAPIRDLVTTSVIDNRATWHFTPTDTDLPFDLYDGMILLDDGGDITPMANLRVVVQPG